jgi:hypothetical protein
MTATVFRADRARWLHVPFPGDLFDNTKGKHMRTLDDHGDTQATGTVPTDTKVAEPTTGRAGTETNVAKAPRADTGNVVHDYGVAMTTDDIKNWVKP